MPKHRRDSAAEIMADITANSPDLQALDQPLSESDRVDTVRCPACHALPGDPCTEPTNIGRRRVTWVHNARKDLAQGWT
jgi:hypothetical protein